MNESLNKWLMNDFSLDLDKSLNDELNREYLSTLNKIKIVDKIFTGNNSNFGKCLHIIHEFSKKPWTLQAEMCKKLDIKKEDLIKLNSIIRNSELFQNIILKKGVGNKYWNTIIH